MSEATATLESLRERRDAAALTREIATLEAQAYAARLVVAAESMAGWAGMDIVDPREWRTDAWGQPLGYGAYETDARKDGANKPFIETEADLRIMQATSRLLVDSNPYAEAALENLTNYVIGTGLTYTAATKKKRTVPDRLIEAVQDVIDEIVDVNEWAGDLEREAFQRTRRDGEALVRLHPGPGGIARFRMIEPEYLRAPIDPRAVEEFASRRYPMSCPEWQAWCWSWGIQTPDGDVVDARGYHVDWQPGTGDFEYIPASECEHLKINVDRNIKRGVSDFFQTGDWLGKATALLGGVVSGATVQSKIAMITTYEAGVSGTGVNSGIQAVSDGSIRRANASGATRQIETRKFENGTILHAPQGRRYDLGALGQSQGPVYIEVLQAALRAIACRWSMPEYMISADASNNNFASILESGSPFRKAVEAAQFFYKSRFKRLFWKALLFAFNAGRFNRFGLTWSEFQRVVEIQIEAPIAEVQNRTEETNRRAILKSNGLLSLKTWAGQESLDFEQEQANGAKPDEVVGAFAGSAGSDGASAGGEYAGISRQQWKRNNSALKDVTDDLTAGRINEAVARTKLAMLGLTPSTIDMLITAAADGTVSDEEIAAAESASVRHAVIQEAVRQVWESYP